MSDESFPIGTRVQTVKYGAGTVVDEEVCHDIFGGVPRAISTGRRGVMLDNPTILSPSPAYFWQNELTVC
jgi:hypothetical protein